MRARRDPRTIDHDTRVVPRTKLWEGLIVLECGCGNAVGYPGHPDERTEVQCPGCGTVWKVES